MLTSALPFVLTLAVTYVAAASDPLQLRLTSGTFRGQTVSNVTDSWLGIPFAQPPTGSLRFKAPVPITRPAPEVQNAASFGSSCPQPSLGGSQSEDCLFLNVCNLLACVLSSDSLRHRYFVPQVPQATQSFLSWYGFMYVSYTPHDL